MVWGDSCSGGGNLSGARSEYERCLEIAPKYAQALIGLGLVLEQQGHIDEAIRMYQQVDRSTEYDGSVRLSLGFAYLRKGMTSEALREFRVAAQFGVPQASELIRLANGFLQTGSIRDAQETLEVARRHIPDESCHQRNPGLCVLAPGTVARGSAGAGGRRRNEGAGAPVRCG